MGSDMTNAQKQQKVRPDYIVIDLLNLWSDSDNK